MAKPRLLILAFSPIAADARVLKQVQLFVDKYQVTTCGYGPAPSGVVRHIRIPDEKLQNDWHPKKLVMRLYNSVYWHTSAVAWCKGTMTPGSWDVILANDFETVPLALSLEPKCGVHADIHEYSPRLHSESKGWMLWVAPYYRWMARRYVRRVTSSTTVGEGLAGQYEKEFGFLPAVVTNATPEWDLAPSSPSTPLRLVHSGAGLKERSLGLMLDAVQLAKAPVTLDLYLTPNHPAHIAELRDRAAGIPGVTVHDPVPYQELVPLLNTFDVGVFVLPPVNFSYEWALPNKIFDFIQARLAIVVGPSPEMERIVSAHKLGLITRDFSAHALADAIDELSPQNVETYKKNAHATASVLTAESQMEGWLNAISKLAADGEQPFTDQSTRRLRD